MANGISINTVKPTNDILDHLFADEKYKKNIVSESAKNKIDLINSILSPVETEQPKFPNADDQLPTVEDVLESIEDKREIKNSKGQVLLGGIEPSTLEVPEGYKEAYQYWSTSELMTFQFELALQTRWESIGTKALLNAVSIVKDVGSVMGGLWDWVGLEGLIGKTASAGSSAFVPGGWVFPIKGYTGAVPKRDTDGGYQSSGKPTRSLGNGTKGFHAGVDLFMPEGTPVLAVTSGMVTRTRNDNGGYAGNNVYHNDSTDTYQFYYTHLLRVADGIASGHMVTAGQVIGYVGKTGNAADTPAHLHFGIKIRSKHNETPMHGYVDPEELLRNATFVK